MRYTVKPHNVCAASLSFDLDGDVVRNAGISAPGRQDELSPFSLFQALIVTFAHSLGQLVCAGCILKTACIAMQRIVDLVYGHAVYQFTDCL